MTMSSEETVAGVVLVQLLADFQQTKLNAAVIIRGLQSLNSLKFLLPVEDFSGQEHPNFGSLGMAHDGSTIFVDTF
ncbi:hypothetical protein QE152_g34993 [Popillia japonica]|uniref:Uncharacterized protein n=1 Tax=Popillia japonica TaxID=7064 RepID=A0AAW1ISU4_POPJA